MYSTLTDGERDILTEQNAEAADLDADELAEAEEADQEAYWLEVDAAVSAHERQVAAHLSWLNATLDEAEYNGDPLPW